MPLGTFKTRAFELIKQYRKELGTDELIDVMEPVIDALAAQMSGFLFLVQ